MTWRGGRAEKGEVTESGEAAGTARISGVRSCLFPTSGRVERGGLRMMLGFL